jgi:hypothetical protein
MPTAEDLAAAHYLQQSAVSTSAAYRAQAMWQMVDRSRIADSWAELLPQVVQTVTAAQYMAASGAQGYITGALQAQGLDDAGATIIPSAFAGTAADGRSLAGLLSSPAYTALSGIGAGASVDRAMAAGLNQLVMLASSTVTDAGRVADGVGVATRSTRTGYIRMLSPPSCARCAILAGRFYRWNDGFQRHPQCKCIHIPTEENASGDKRTDPYAYFKSLSAEDQRKYFTDAGAKAINDGADINQVVNSRRGMNAAGMKTTEGTSKRGYYRGESGSKVRLTPEAIYKLNGNDRAAAIRDLEKYGYIIPQGQVPGGAIRNGVR